MKATPMNPIAELERRISDKRKSIETKRAEIERDLLEIEAHEKALNVLRPAYGVIAATVSAKESEGGKTLIDATKKVIETSFAGDLFKVKQVIDGLQKQGYANELKNPQARIGQIIAKLKDEGFVTLMSQGLGNRPSIYKYEEKSEASTATTVEASNVQSSPALDFQQRKEEA
jgi:hypothetical protein